MSESKETPAATATTAPKKNLGMRVNGKQWRSTKSAFRKPGAGLVPYEVRAKKRAELDAVKAKEKEMKQEKEDERRQRIEALKARREAKAEKERYEQLAVKMHRKRVERLKRREKRNKKLNS